MSASFGILGPIVVTVDGRTVDLGAPKQRALLALLLIHPNRVIATDRILDQLWGDDAHGKENALWVYVSRLRTLLEPERTERGESTYLLTSGHGYMLSADPASIDAVLFEREAAEGRRLIRTDPGAASELLARALQRWRGSALQEFTYEDFARGEITRLEELRLGAMEDRIESDLILGRSRELLGELESLRESHPLRERLVAQQMLALHRTGRQADALRAFERFRRHLATELALEPSAELRRLEEQVLLQDPRLEERSGERSRGYGVVTGSAANPYKGLRPFGEEDAAVFFGRERLVAEVMRRISHGTRLLALVGPSGSGKSSVVRAGVIPAMRKGGPSGDAKWLVAQMVPGSHPFAELEAALLRSSLDAPATLRPQLEAPDTGLLRAALRMLPDPDTRLLVVIDQFEELFTLGDDEVRNRFLAQLVTALDDTRGRVFVLLTLRSDFYGQPLAHPAFGARLGDGVINVVPLLPNELESAAERPAISTGVSFEPALLGTLLAEVAGRPGTLPLFQFALAELFDRRIDDTLTLAIYRDMGGVEGAVTTRAEDLYLGLGETERAAAKQLFLRLVTIADGGEQGRRRVPASEITTLDIDVVALQQVIDAYTRNRLLTLDRDHVSDSPTVEVSHEALLTEWARLQQWIEAARDDIRRRAALQVAMSEWEEADRARDYLLAGSRLQVYEDWASESLMRLTVKEREYLDASMRLRDEVESAEAERLANEHRLAASARRRLWALAALLTVLLTASVLMFVFAIAPEPASVAVIMPNLPDEQEGLTRTGTERAERELGVRIEELTGRFSDLEATYREVAATGADLIFIDNANSGWQWVEEVIADHPATAFAVINGVLAPSGAHAVYFADEQAGYLAGAAGALATKTGVIGFVGNYQSDTSERWRAGFEAGARAVSPSIELHSIYTGSGGSGDDSLSGRAAADELYRRNADVVIAFAGDATSGVIEAAFQHFQQTGVHRWVIGSESDWSIALSTELRPHVLTSAIRQWDVAVFDTIRQYVEGDLSAGITMLGLDVGAVALARSEHLTPEQLATIEDLSREVAEGQVTIPRAPTGELLPPPGVVVSHTVTVTWDGRVCTYADNGDDPVPGETIRVDFVNNSSEYRYFFTFQSQRGIQVSTLVQPNTHNAGYITLHAGTLDFRCGSEIRTTTRAEVAAHTATAHSLTLVP